MTRLRKLDFISLGMKCYVIIALLLTTATQVRAENVVDSQTQVVFEIIDGTETVEISSTQSLYSFYGSLTIHPTVTDENPDSKYCGKTFTVVGMQPMAFQYCPLHEIIIEAQIPVIPEYAFNYCSNLTSVTLPETIERFDQYCFNGCRSLQSMEGGPELTSIGRNAFYGCSSLESFDLSKSTKLQNIGISAFASCSKLPFPEFPVLESEYLDLGNSSFAGCSNLGNVVIPDNTRIHSYAFQSSTITSLTFPKNPGWMFGPRNANDAYAGKGAFSWAYLPEEIVIPSSTPELPAEVFYHAYSLKNVTIGDNPELKIGASAFESVTTLETLTFEGKLSTIGEKAFRSTALKQVTIPPYDQLGSACFSNIYSLTEINFPDTPFTFDTSAKTGSTIFSENRSLTEVTLPDWITEIPVGLFSQCSKLKTVNFPKNLVKIGNDAFASTAIELTENSFPSTLKEIGMMAFGNVSTIKELYLPASLEKIGVQAFKDCIWLTLPNFEEVTSLIEIGWGAFYNCASIKSIAFPPNLKSVGSIEFADYIYNVDAQGAFQNCSNIETIKLNNGVQLGINCFYNSGVKAIEWPEDEVKLCHGAFRQCSRLREVHIPGYITHIPSETFYLSQGLTDLTIGDGVETIGGRAFMNCNQLSNVNLGNTVRNIGAGSFAFTKASLNTLPESVTSVEMFAFWHASCSGTFTIPSTVTFIGDNAFCANNISAINFPAFPDYDQEKLEAGIYPITIGANVFSNNVIENITLPDWMIRVPAGLLRQETSWDAYKMSYGTWYWPRDHQTMGDYTDHKDVLKSVTFAPNTVAVGDYAFANNKMLSIGEFPPTITSYGQYCFTEGGKSLTTETVTDPENGEQTQEEVYLGVIIAAPDCDFKDGAFSHAKIKSIIFEGCAHFGNDALAGMEYIREIEFPECMTEIPGGFCKEWKILEDVRFKNNKVEYIGREAFLNCPKLKSIPDLSNLTELTTIGKAAFANCGQRDNNGNGIDFNGDLDLSKLTKLTTIDEEAFCNTPVTSVKWPQSEEFTLGKKAFHLCNLSSVVIPKNVYLVGASCFGGNPIAEITFEERTDPDKKLILGAHNFYNNQLLTSVHFPDCNLELGTSIFNNCSNIEEITWPASDSREVTLGKSAFMYNTKLKFEKLPLSITELPDTVFAGCSSLVDIKLPGVNKIGITALGACENLNSVEIGGDLSEIGESAFINCNKLTSISMAIAPGSIGNSAFWGCLLLSDFEVLDPERQKVHTLGTSAFSNCQELVELPDMFDPNGTIAYNAFRWCYKLKWLKIPPYFNNTGIVPGYFKGDHYRFAFDYDLQSIDWLVPLDGNEQKGSIRIYTDDFNYDVTPLKGISYMRGNMNTNYLPKLTRYNTNYNAKITRTRPIKLMVSRANKYKFVEKDYEQPNAAGEKFFDIREIKDPMLKLHGEIFSTFDVGEDINHYTGVIRWQMELSDLDEVNSTEYELWRDGIKVARFIFEPPVLEQDGVSDKSVETHVPTYSVAYKAYDANDKDITEELQYGDFYFERSENRFTYTLQTAQSKVYFNGSSTARIGQAEKLGRESWFLYKDRFDSPRLNTYGVPVSHTYVLKMKNYDYLEWENNDGYLPGEDGEYYHLASKRTGLPGQEWMESNPCVVYTSIAHPSIAIDGLYDREQVEADLDRSLEVTTVPENATYAISYNVAGGAVNHINHDTGNYIVERVQAYKLADREDLTSDNTTWGESREINGIATGIIAGPEDEIIPGQTTFQTVTTADYRGTFGSPKVSLLGAPALRIVAAVDNSEATHRHEFWSESRKYHVYLNPILAAFGYDEQMALSPDKYFIGLWRQQTIEEIPNRAVSIHNDGIEDAEETLVWHSGGANLQEYQHNCEICSEVGYDPDTKIFTDHVLHPNVSTSQIKYVARMYVQKPDDPSKWGVAEAESDPITVFTASGLDMPVEDISSLDLDHILGEATLFNLQGLQIKEPAPGSVFIALINGQVLKLRLSH